MAIVQIQIAQIKIKIQSEKLYLNDITHSLYVISHLGPTLAPTKTTTGPLRPHPRLRTGTEQVPENLNS